MLAVTGEEQERTLGSLVVFPSIYLDKIDLIIAALFRSPCENWCGGHTLDPQPIVTRAGG